MSVAIPDVATLNAIGDGGIITADDTTYTKVDGRWRHEAGFMLDSQQFTLDIGRGQVRTGANPRVGQLWMQDGTYGYAWIVLRNPWPNPREGGDAMVLTARVNVGNGGTLNAVMPLSPEAMPGRLVPSNEEHPDWYRTAYVAGGMVARYMERANEWERQAADRLAQIDGLQTRIRELESLGHRSIDEYRERFQEVMHAWARGPFDRESFNEALVDLGMERVKQTVQINVCITGTTPVTVSKDALDGLLPDGVEANRQDSDEMTTDVGFHTDITIERDVDHGTCVCPMLTTDDVWSALREQGRLHVGEIERFNSECVNG